MLAGVMWEEHRPVDHIEVEFAGAAPDPARLALDVTTNTPTDTQDNRPTWWTRKPEPFPGSAAPRGDGRVIDYRTDLEAVARSLEGYPRGFRYEPDPGGIVLVDTVRLRYTGDGAWPVVTGLRVFGSARVSPASVAIEWGARPGDAAADFTGTIELYNGTIAKVEPLDDSTGVTMSGPFAWRSVPAAGRRGVAVELGYVADDTQEVRFTPATFLPVGGDGSLRFHPNRTVVTVRTAGGTFSFAPRDLEDGPIIVPGAGFAVARTGDDASRRLPVRANPAHGTVRHRVRALPEQSFAQALADHYGVDRPPMPEPEVEAPMRIDVPDAFAEAAWRLAYWHVRRRCMPSDDGIPQFVIWPYKALLGQESWRIFVALDLLGEHGVTRSGFEPWFRVQGTVVARGCFDGPEGALNVPGWDLNHSQGHGSMLYAMAEHHLLSGDDAWLAEHRTGLTDACEWIARQRRRWTGLVGQDSWSAGLMPPGEFGDYADWRSLYQTNVFHWRALKTAARSFQAIDTTAAQRWTDEADDFLRAIRSAASRSGDLAPVVRVFDGTYRRYIPPHPWLRGRCDLIANPYSGGHAGTLVMDSDCGAVALGLGALPDDDPLMDEYLDVLEDDLYLDNWMVRMHARERRRATRRAGSAWVATTTSAATRSPPSSTCGATTFPPTCARRSTSTPSTLILTTGTSSASTLTGRAKATGVTRPSRRLRSSSACGRCSSWRSVTASGWPEVRPGTGWLGAGASRFVAHRRGSGPWRMRSSPTPNRASSPRPSSCRPASSLEKWRSACGTLEVRR